MPEPKAQLVDPQGPIDVPGLSVTGVTTATGGFAGNVQGAATGLASTTANLSVGIVTATKFQGNTTGNVSGLADGTNINVGIITSTSFTGDLVGNAAGLSTTTANINAGIMSATSFAGNFTGVASGITGTPNIVVGIMTGTLKGDGSGLTGIAATNWIANNVTANSSTTAIDLALGNVVKFTQSADTTVSFANTGTSNIVTFIRLKDSSTTARSLTWPSAIKWNGGSAPTLITDWQSGDANVITLLTRDEGVTWYGWETVNKDSELHSLYGWGYNSDGRLGINQPGPSARSSPTQVPGTNWGYGSTYSYSLYSKSDGTLWAWGDNTWGMLGQNSASEGVEYSSPVQIPGTNWASDSYYNVRANYTVASALKTDGTLWIWGNNYKGKMAQGPSGSGNTPGFSSPVQIPGTDWKTCCSAGNYFTVSGCFATKTDGTAWAWGSTAYGQLGLNQGGTPGPNSPHISSPTQIPGTNWDRIEMNGSETLAVGRKTDGTLWIWGYNAVGRMGIPSLAINASRSSPLQIPGSTWSDKFSNYGSMVHAIKTDGTLWCWGGNGQGHLGQNNRTAYSSPVQIPGTTWKNVVSFSNGAAAIKTDNTIWSWGYNAQGQLGINNTTTQRYSSPVQCPGTNWSRLMGNGAVFATKKVY